MTRPTSGPSRRLLLAGSYGPERIPSRRERDEPSWFEPLHVRAEEAARERIAAQVAAGADVVIAPTWLTHRRALRRVAETRRAAAWTAAAVRVARDGVELGLERREEEALSGHAQRTGQGDDELDRAVGSMDVPRPLPLIGAVLPALEEDPSPDTGRLLSTEAATVRDYRDQASLLADAEPDLILVEASRIAREAIVAVEEAVDTGTRTWAAAPAFDDPVADEGAALSRWLEASRNAGAETFLLPAPIEQAARVADGSAPHWGGLIGPDIMRANDTTLEEAVHAWLDRGALVVALLDGAAPTRLRELREAIDRYEAVGVAAAAKLAARWIAHVANAGRMAPGGMALWLDKTPEAGLPDGFHWLVTDETEIRHFSPARFSLIVAAEAHSTSVERLAPLLREGGILALAQAGPAQGIEGLRTLVIDTDAEPTLLILRCED